MERGALAAPHAAAPRRGSRAGGADLEHLRPGAAFSAPAEVATLRFQRPPPAVLGHAALGGALSAAHAGAGAGGVRRLGALPPDAGLGDRPPLDPARERSRDGTLRGPAAAARGPGRAARAPHRLCGAAVALPRLRAA